MGKFEIKYSDGDIVFVMCDNKPRKCKVVDFSIEHNANGKTTFEERVRYKLEDVIKPKNFDNMRIFIYDRPNTMNIQQKCIYTSYKNLINSLETKFNEKYGGS